MKICQKCGNLVADAEQSCQKCGTTVEIAYVNNNQTEQVQQAQQVQQVQQPVQQVQFQQVQQSVPIKSSKKENKILENLKKNYKPISIAVIILLLVLSIYLATDNISLRKKIKLNSTSAVESNYKIQDNTNNSNQVVISAEEEKYNFEIPEGTYPKVSQNYVFFVDEDYVATVIEQSGGISLLNLKTGGTGWIGISRATLEGYRNQKESLKSTYTNRGITVTNMYDQIIEGKDCLVLELMQDNQPSMLIITQASSTECFIITITNTNIKTSQDTTTMNELLKMISMTKTLS